MIYIESHYLFRYLILHQYGGIYLDMDDCCRVSMEPLIREAGRIPRQRTTLYGVPDAERISAGRSAAPLQELKFQPAKHYRAAS